MSKKEWQYAAGWALGVMALTCLPYFVVWFLTPGDAYFPFILFNSDDHGVYFAWMRQAADGQLLFRNLFTNEPQRGVYLQPYFLVLGWLARLPGLDVPLAYHLGRCACGAATLILVYRLAAFFTPDVPARRVVFWTTALSGGLGWLFWADQVHQSEPVDVWQPEALTFPSLYTNGLFCAALALMLGVVVCLLLAEERGFRWAVGAGLCALALGIVHSYDVIHLTLAWGLFLGARWAIQRRFPQRAVLAGLITAAFAAVTVGYMAWLYLNEPVFRARANVATWSPKPHLYLLGFGLLVPLAIRGGLVLRAADRDREGADAWRWLLPPAWILGAVVAAYLPFAFQRKMIMGIHLPLSLLAGIAVADLARRMAARVEAPASRPSGKVAAVCAVLIALTTPTTGFWLTRDVRVAREKNLTSTGLHPAYWYADTIHALQWIGKNTPRDAVLLAWPVVGMLAPAFSGRAVYAGHWGETPRFEDRFRDVAWIYGLSRRPIDDAQRAQWLREHGITYVLSSPYERDAAEAGGTTVRWPEGDPHLQPVFREGRTTVYAVQ